jgi:hypothetical protein
MIERQGVQEVSSRGSSRQILLEQLVSAIGESSAPVYIYVFPAGKIVPLSVETSMASAVSMASDSLSQVGLSSLLAVCPESLGQRIKPLLESGWLTQKGYEGLSGEYRLTTTEIVVFLLKYGGWVTKGKEQTMNGRIADLLSIRSGTVKKHIQNILWKIGEEGNRDSIQIHRWAISEDILAIDSSAQLKRLLADPP